MTTEEEQQLRELGEDLAQAAINPAEPRCIARAFATPRPHALALTMQRWIDLEAIHSPLLRLELPAPPDELEAAARVFGLTIHDLTPREALTIAGAMRRATAEAFAMALPMRHPNSAGESHGDGFGAWLPLLAFLVIECGLDPTAARALRVDQAFALLAAGRRNQGWICAGASYAQRDFLAADAEEPAVAPSCKEPKPQPEKRDV